MPNKGRRGKSWVAGGSAINATDASLPKGARDRRNWTSFGEGPVDSAPDKDGKRFARDKLRFAREYAPGSSFQVEREGGAMDEYGVNLTYPNRRRQRNQVKWRDAIPKLQGTNVYATLTEEDIDEMVDLENAKELEKLYKFVLSLVDPREPGHLDWLREKFPAVYNALFENRKRRQALQNRRENLAMFGVQNEADAYFALMDKSGYFEEQAEVEGYVPGFLAPRHVFVEQTPRTRSHAGANWANYIGNHTQGQAFPWGTATFPEVPWHQPQGLQFGPGRPDATRRLPIVHPAGGS